ncbi:MAG TPA: nitrate- and nitrite sensing domain-containing protein, partial [Actinophytocola sp.]
MRPGIRGKLNMLLLLPLAAVLVIAVPFVLGQIDNARSAGQTALAAHHTREIGGLISELQQERLLTAAYLAAPTTSDSALVRQQRTVDRSAGGMYAALAHGGAVSDELSAALVRIGSLREIRENALRRGVSLDSVARTYHAIIGALVDALRLVPQRTSDAEGTRQLTALEALLRANEQNSLYGMALIVAAVSPETGTVLLDDAAAQADLSTERFVQQADVEHAALVVTVTQGQEARRIAELATRLPGARDPGAGTAFVADALAAAEAQSSLRRIVQDRVTSQITDAAAGRADGARSVAWTVGLGAAGLFVLVALLTVVVSRSIANPLRRLTSAATRVADLAQAELVRVTDTEVPEEQVPRLSAIELSSKDELGDLAAAFNRVQATAAMLVERQAVTRRNVSLIFANVAQRTQNLVGRQATLVDELERDEQNTELLERLYRLDHISTRLRRNAENLLVVAGSRDENKIAGPIELATALRSALAEIEDYQRVRLGAVDELMLASQLGPDLILMFAELLENATAFSPPESFVDVGTTFGPDGSCVVSIVDHGIGMPPERMAEENHRLVQRERLDIAPTSVLGLFVVGRLARRHSLWVELGATPGGGVTARVAIPPNLFSPKAAPAREPEPAAAPGQT